MGRRRNIFQHARRHLELLKKLSEPKKPAKCKWRDPAARREYLKARAQANRAAWLDRLVPDRRCVECGEVKAASRSWVIYKDPGKVTESAWRAVCRSCTMRNHREVWGRGADILPEII